MFTVPNSFLCLHIEFKTLQGKFYLHLMSNVTVKTILAQNENLLMDNNNKIQKIYHPKSQSPTSFPNSYKAPSTINKSITTIL